MTKKLTTFRAALIVGVSLGILTWGSHHSQAEYGAWGFTRQLLPFVFVAALWAVASSLLLLPASKLRLGPPKRPLSIWPALLLPLPAALSWTLHLSHLGHVGPSFLVEQSYILLTTLLVGLGEEWVYRGVLLAAFEQRYAPRKSVLLAGACFGAVHFINIFMTGSLGASLAQVLLTFVIGGAFLLAATRTASLWPGVILHFVYDFFLMSLSGLSAKVAPFLLALPLLGAVSLGLCSWFLLMRDSRSPPPTGPEG